MRTSIIIKIFISFLLASLLPIGALIAYHDWANRYVVYNMKKEEIKTQARKLAKIIDRELSIRKGMIQGLCNKHPIRVDTKEASSPLFKHQLEKLINYFELSIRKGQDLLNKNLKKVDDKETDTPLIKNRMERVINSIELFIRKGQNLFNKQPTSVSEKETDTPLFKSRMKRLINYFNSSESIFILGIDGNIAVTNTNDIQIKNYSTRDFFKKAMNGDTYVSEPAMDQGKGYIYYSTPIKNSKNEIIGILVMRRQAEELWKLFEEEKDLLGKGSLCILTDEYGVRIAHATNRSLIFKSWTILDPEVKKKLEIEHHYGEDIPVIGFTEMAGVPETPVQSVNSYFIHPLAANTEDYHGYCVSLKEKNWKLTYAIPTSTFIAQVNHLTKNAIFSTAITFIIVIALTWLLLVSLLRPIKRLTSAAHEIVSGKLDHPINNGPRQDEIGKLMQIFDVMRHKLRGSYKELKSANIEAILMLARACEVRDEDTGNHVLRVSHYSTALAKELGLDESFLKELGPSSILHDVGKIHIPDHILRKPGRLTDEEREIMKGHPLYGARILGNNKFFHVAREIARWHHENWDGTGYPDGLKGEEITIAARIVRLVDTYDALVTKRHYKHPWSDREAYNEIVNYSGAYFDPYAVNAFTRLFERGVIQEIKIKYA